MRKGDTTTIRIDRLGTDGVGSGTVEGRPVKVPGTVPGDVAEITVTQIKRRSARGEMTALVEQGIERVKPPCPHFSVCGGCRWQDIPYPYQLSMKAALLKNALSGLSGYRCPDIIPMAASPDVFYYRNKMEFSFDRPPGSAELFLGLHEPGRFASVFDVDTCMLESDRSNRIVVEVRRFARERGLSVWGLKSHRGLLRYLVIREGKVTGETMVNLVTSGDDFPELDDFVRTLLAAVPQITTIVRSINRSPAAVAVGEERLVLAGDGYIHDHLGDHTFVVSPDSFFQTNTRQAEHLYRTVGEFCRLTGTERVLDLYCGTGTIGISVAGHAASVTGIEQVKDAVDDAHRNARLNGIDNIGFIAGKVEAVLGEDTAGYDVAICDPPRAGIHPRAMDWLVRILVPRMVYVSCNSTALARDLAVLLLAGYRIGEIRAFDMSPHTPHIETVVLLER